MKRIYLTLMFIGMLALAFVSCDKEDPVLDPPTISVSPPTAEAVAGDTVSFDVTVSGDQELTSVAVSATSAGASGTSTDIIFGEGEHSDVVGYDYVVPTGLAAGSAITLTFTLTDKEALSDTATAVITIDEIIPDTVVSIFSDVAIETGLGNGEGEDLFASSTGEVYTFDEVSGDAELTALIDLMYFYNDETLKSSNALSAVITSPDNVPDAFHNGTALADANSTTLKKVDDVDFDAITPIDDSILAGITDISADRVGSLAVGDIVAFMTEAGKIGVLKVVEINGTYNQHDNIVISVKVQK
ncbi:hypothetical protein ACFLTE_01830 [Bacteroidota bacterium]